MYGLKSNYTLKMNRKQIQNKLKDHTLSSHEREVLLQTLHYLTAEGLEHASSNNSSSKRSPKSLNYTRKKRSSSNNNSKRNSSSS